MRTMLRQFRRAAIVAAAAMLPLLATGAAAQAAPRDRTAPTVPSIGYISTLRWNGDCWTVTLSVSRSTDNVTPQPKLRYDVFADGVYIGTLVDHGHPAGSWGILYLNHDGPNAITARAVDAAGNRSAPSGAKFADPYAC
jgi:hypothetical protein